MHIYHTEGEKTSERWRVVNKKTNTTALKPSSSLFDLHTQLWKETLMITLIFMFLVLCGLIVFLTIWEPISNIFNSKMIAGGLIGYLIAKYMSKKGDHWCRSWETSRPAKRRSRCAGASSAKSSGLHRNRRLTPRDIWWVDSHSFLWLLVIYPLKSFWNSLIWGCFLCVLLTFLHKCGINKSSFCWQVE